MNRVRMPRGLDRIIFRNSATRTKAVNKPFLSMRGGRRF